GGTVGRVLNLDRDDLRVQAGDLQGASACRQIHSHRAAVDQQRYRGGVQAGRENADNCRVVPISGDAGFIRDQEHGIVGGGHTLRGGVVGGVGGIDQPDRDRALRAVGGEAQRFVGQR